MEPGCVLLLLLLFDKRSSRGQGTGNVQLPLQDSSRMDGSNFQFECICSTNLISEFIIVDYSTSFRLVLGPHTRTQY
ncbi:uncharacterized protein EDB93DRAFT_1185434 [Suillus bovinus]|uniref:uncharacterized protein n=1 Tax=Suillus bovinus TaxID=48563 RepID=UPI001B87C643|nr:uncharacterized protein EDB93DRAFT_1185434 [Suillus bovinus]KAG2128031.1 hypothetical protein EDB93DRAFT_1185434 [Suillus bovinus]